LTQPAGESAVALAPGPQRTSWTAVLPLLQGEFGLSLIQIAWLVSTFNGLAAMLAIFFGVFADRVGAFRLCLAGTLCIAAGSAAGALSHSAFVLIVSRLVEGLGFLSVVVSAPGLITAASAPERRGIALGLWSAYLPLGVSVVIAASPPLLAASGWRATWWLVAGAAIACAALLVSQSRHYAQAREGSARSLAAIRASLAQPVVWLLGLAFAMYTIQHNGVMVWLPTYLLDTRGLDATSAALATALVVFVNCFGNALGGWLIQRGVPRGRIIGATFIVTSLTFLAIFSAQLPDSIRYVLAVFYSFITGLVPAAVLSAGMRYARSGAEVGAVQGLIVHITNVGIFFGVPLIAASVTWGGSWNAALWVLLGCAAVALASAWIINRFERRT
jgi:CP family cyanate transporter-like MFS transporter